MRTKLFSLFLIVSTIAPAMLYAESGTLSTEDTLRQLILIVSQSEARIKQLESENAILRNEMAKAGIKISLTEYS